MTTGTMPFEIILAEDNAADIGLVREALKQHNVTCELRVIRDGAEAMALIDNLATDPNAPRLALLLLDLHLPKHGGQDILKRFRSIERYAQTPVIMLTGLDSSVIEEMKVVQPALSYFQKPGTLDEFIELGAMIRRVLEAGGKLDPEKAVGGAE